MSEYFEYLRLMLEAFFKDFGIFFKDVFASPWDKVGSNVSHYNELFATYSANFGFWGWFFFVLFILIFTAFIGGLCFLIFLGLRKYIRFVKKEISKDKLEETIERLNYELFNAIKEKDKILALKVGELGYKPTEKEKEEAKEVIDEVNSRFPKLTYVDHQYKDFDNNIADIEGLTLEEICTSFRNFAASQLHLYYTIDTIRQLFAGMATSKLIILEGISGTGKTSLPYAMGKFFNFDANICSVQPSWKDRSELIGYYNEFTKKFNETEFLKALYTSIYRKDVNLIVLDEMNLARIEYYFAEFLSVMEMPNVNEWKIELINSYSDTDPKFVQNGKILIPQNVIFFGTANNDDSTFTISDKVYDRAISLFFDNKGIPFEADIQESINLNYDQLERLYKEAQENYPVSEKLLDKFAELDDFVIAKFKLAFGNRILKQLKIFIPTYVACGGTDLDGLDFIFTNKILKKFESLNIAFLRDELKQLNTKLDTLFGKGSFKMAHKYIDNLIKMAQ
ncbi:MAG: hypothetical protein SPI36_02805 [Candidatus Onthovivens sp.]|nr:hypothetical protein [Candidatus Onthovivens sp.]